MPFFSFCKQRFFMLLSALLLLMAAGVTVGAMTLNHWLYDPLPLVEDTVIRIQKGDNLSKVAYRLENEGVINSARLLVLYARATKQTTVKIGEYLLPKNSHRVSLLSLLQSDNVLSYKVTLVEGKTFQDFLLRLKSNEKIVSTLNDDVGYPELLRQLNIDLKHPEGWFFPDTYQFSAGITDVELLQQAHQRMQTVLAEEWDNRAESLPYQSAYEALIMASIIEKETGVAYERPEIAGVFVRRLQKGMRLQTDPTIIYGLGKDYTGNIRRKHLRQKTPYNTYMIDGLPPTPIAMPGREAINAALNPKEGNSLYFVAKGDGSHYFSATLVEHNRAVRKYQINKRAEQYRSSPPPASNQ